MKFYTTTLAATSALCLSMGMAHADSNTLYLEQIGTGNVADIVQDTGVAIGSSVAASNGGAGNNDIGTLGDPVTQNGNNNFFRYSNIGSGNANLRGNNDIIKAEQNGNDNQMRFGDGNWSVDNVTQDAQQIGDDNYLSVGHNGGKRNIIGSILEDGGDNHIRINQNGHDGNISNVSIVGSGNGGSSHSSWYENWGILIQQSGDNNSITNASIEGSNNDGWPGSRGTAMRINQTGTSNTASAAMMGSDGNRVLIDQGGVGNNIAEVIQGDTLASTNNNADVLQNGDGNATTVEQLGSYNTVYADFMGDGNGVGTMTGVAGALADGNLGDNLFQGNVFQDSSAAPGLGNWVSYTVTGSHNLYAFAQIGGDNSITGTVGSDSNQVAVLQTGTGNVTGFTQTGGNNNAIAVSQ